MKTMELNRPSRLCVAMLLGVAIGLSTARAQSDRLDPTVTPAAMADAIRVQLAELRALTIRALIVGADNNGIALLQGGAETKPATTGGVSGEGLFTVRAGSSVSIDANGIPLKLVISRVSDQGVEIEAPTLSERLRIPGSFKAISREHDIASGRLRYLECNQLPVETVLRLIADQTDANLSPTAKAAQINATIFLRDIAVEDAVEELCRTCNLWFRKDPVSGLTRVTTMEEYESNLSSFREEITESFTLLYPNVTEVASVIYGLYPERVTLSLGESDILDNELDDLSQRFERFNAFSSDSSSGLLRQTPGSVGSYGGGSGSGIFTTSRGRTVRVGAEGHDDRYREAYSGLTADDAKAVESAQQQGDGNARQNLLERYREKSATIFITASRRNNLLIVRTGDAQALENIRSLIRRLDVPTPMLLLEVKVLQLALNDDFTSSFEYEFQKSYNKSATRPVDTTAGFPGFNPLAATARSDSMSFMALSRSLNVRIQMLEQEGRIKTLATPMLLTANNEVSRLFIGEERPMVRDISVQTVVTENAAPIITIDPQTELESVGTMLLITPNINADRTVTLRLMQENSKIIKNDASIPVYSPSGGGVILNVPVDITSSRVISGTFIAKDQMTVAAGGLIEESELDQERRVPILGRIPLLGWLFRSTERVKSRTEMIMLITPHVISTPAEGEAISRRRLEALSAHPARDGRDSLDILRQQEDADSKVPLGDQPQQAETEAAESDID